MPIHKQVLMQADHQTIKIPIDAKILTVQIQKEDIVIWYSFNDKDVLMDVVIHMYVTGNDSIPGYMDYIGTIQLYNGNFVLHVFKEIDTSEV